MGLSAREQWRWWGFGLILFIGFLWIMGQTLLPFLAGAAMAYLLDPAADKLEERGFSRVWATVAIMFVLVLVLVAVITVLIPLLVDQIKGLVDATPVFVRGFQAWLSERFPALLEEGSSLRTALASLAESTQEHGAKLLNSVLASGLLVLDFLLILVVAPVVAFYLLMDWDRMIAAIDELLPREHAETIRDVSGQIDQVLAGFVRGQLSVCAILGVFYALSLVIIGLQFGLVIGLFAGMISFIPFVGSVLGGLLSIGVAIFQFWDDPVWIAVVAGVFAIGQAVEGNILTPKLVGGSIGLHPVWLMFALSAFGALFGFSGLLIAVPAAAAIGVIGRFGVAQYRQGRLYRGPGQE